MAPRRKGAFAINGLDIARIAAQALRDKKAIDVRVLDIGRDSWLADYVVIGSGESGPQLKAMANEAHRALKAAGMKSYRESGTPSSGWIVLDCLDTIIHILSVDARRYYGLEELWPQARTLPDP